jgi:outer membrane protein
MKRQPVAIFSGVLLGLMMSAASLPLWGASLMSPAAGPKVEMKDATLVKILTLEDAFQHAMRSYEDIKIALLDTQSTGLLPWRAVSTTLPDVESGINITHPKEKIYTATAAPLIAAPSRDANITVTQPMFNGSTMPAVMAAWHEYRAGQQGRLFTVREVLFQVAQAYFNLLKYQELVEVARETLKMAEEHNRIASERYDAGQVTKTDLLRAEVEVSRGKRLLSENENNRQLAVSTLARLVGIPQEMFQQYQVEKPEENSGLRLESEDEMKKYIQTGLSKRNDLKQAKREKDAAKWLLRQSKTTFLPKADFVFEQSWVDPETAADRNGFWMAILKFSLPLFDKGERVIDVWDNRYKLRQAELRYEKLKKDVALQIEEAWLACKTFRTNLEAVKKELELSKENYDVLTQRYQLGQATSLDVTDAFTELVSSRTNLVNETYDYHLAILNLLKQAGLFGNDYLNLK